MSEEKNIDFCELRNLVYEITDLNESAIAVLEKVNSMESNKVITVLKCNEEKMNLLLEKLEEEGYISIQAEEDEWGIKTYIAIPQDSQEG